MALLRRGTIAVLVGMLGVLPASALALDAAPPAKALGTDTESGPFAFRNVLVTGDLLVLARYSMPDATPGWQDYGPKGALASLYDATGPLQTRVPPQLGEAITGFYLGAGHGLPWDTGVGEVWLVSNPSLFMANESETASLVFVTTSALILTSEADQLILCNTFRTMLTAVENGDATDAIGPGDLVDTTIILGAGTAMAQNAFAAAAQILPNCFIVGIEGSGARFNPNAPGLRTSLEATVEASEWWGRFDTLAGTWGFTDAAMLGTFIWMGLALAVIVVIVAKWGYAQLGTVAAGITLFVGALFVPHYLLQTVLILLALALMATGGYVYLRVPR